MARRSELRPPRVSVLLTSYNRPAMLAEAIESVLAQTYEDYELIILDDNSSDPGVRNLLVTYWAHPKIRLYKSNVADAERKERVRYAVLANTGLRLAEGEYVTYLCDDDLYLPWRLQVMAARLDAGDCTAVYGGQRCERDGIIVGMRPSAGVLDHPLCVVDHSSVMHTRTAGLAVDGWDEDPANWDRADGVFWERLTAAGHLFHPVGELTDVHRFHSASVSESGIPA